MCRKKKKIPTQKLPRIYKLSTRVFNSIEVEALQLSLQTRHIEIVNFIKINSHDYLIQRTEQNQAPCFLFAQRIFRDLSHPLFLTSN